VFADIEEAIGKHNGKMWESSLIEDDDAIPWIESGGGPAAVRAAGVGAGCEVRSDHDFDLDHLSSHRIPSSRLSSGGLPPTDA
jgi:hypothetical protein